MTAPDRIWVDEDTWFSTPARTSRAVEYVRADLATPAAPDPKVTALFGDMLDYLDGQSPDLCSGGQYNRDLRTRIDAVREGRPA